MKLYDSIIKATAEAAEGRAKSLPAAAAWPDPGQSELVMQRDAAFELGGSGHPSVNYTCVTTGELLPGGAVLLIGRDLPELKGDSPFARIVLLKTDEITEDDAGHDMIRQMEYVRYHVFPKGYMVRVSSTSYEEQVRVSRDAVDEAVVKALKPNAKKVDDITKTLSHILDGLPTDCGHCSLKPVCDEVEGMKEMHMGRKKT